VQFYNFWQTQIAKNDAFGIIITELAIGDKPANNPHKVGTSLNFNNGFLQKTWQ
jgi:hypothetical protein